MTSLHGQFHMARTLALCFGVYMVAVVVAGSGCARKSDEPIAGPGAVNPGALGGRERHETVPEEYASLENTVPPGDEALAAGKALYDKHCVGCHGAEGRGDGPKAGRLDHRPADFTDAHMVEEMTDGAFFWRISEGEGSDMPAFADKLDEQKRWQLVHYLHTFAPSEASEGAGDDTVEAEHEHPDPEPPTPGPE